MQEMTKEELEQLIKEAKKAGKDVSELEAALRSLKEEVKPKLGEKKEVKKTKEGSVIIESTGPAKEEDFE
jgi:hypothetical protein